MLSETVDEENSLKLTHSGNRTFHDNLFLQEDI